MWVLPPAPPPPTHLVQHPWTWSVFQTQGPTDGCVRPGSWRQRWIHCDWCPPTPLPAGGPPGSTAAPASHLTCRTSVRQRITQHVRPNYFNFRQKKTNKKPSWQFQRKKTLQNIKLCYSVCVKMYFIWWWWCYLRIQTVFELFWHLKQLEICYLFYNNYLIHCFNKHSHENQVTDHFQTFTMSSNEPVMMVSVPSASLLPHAAVQIASSWAKRKDSHCYQWF